MAAATPVARNARNDLKDTEHDTLSAMAVSTHTIECLKAAWCISKANAANAQYDNCRKRLIETRIEMLDRKINELLKDHEDIKDNPHPKARELECVLQKQAVVLQEQLTAVFAMTRDHDDHSATGSPRARSRIVGMKKRKKYGASPLDLVPVRRLKREQDIQRAQSPSDKL